MRYAKFTIMTMVASAWISSLLAQTQVDLSKQSRGVDFSGAASTTPMKTGTLLPFTCVAGQMFFLTTAPAGANLYACTATNTWTLETGGSGGGGGGSSASLPDFLVTQTSATVLTIGGTCTTAAPCNARFGNTVYAITQSATATITAGTGTAYIYLLLDGSINVGSNVTVSCVLCTSVSGVTAFPPNSIPLATWAASSGAWAGSTGIDARAFQSTAVVVPQLGLTATSTPGQTLLGIDPTVVGVQTAVPATSATACTQGSWATDGTYYYLCVAANTWGRAALSTF